MDGAGGMLRYPPQLSHGPPISRTLQYKKITKPLLERKRRARINRCLEQLKDLMVGALEAEGENINKLEKADILELTVRHLHRITRPHNPTEEVQRFQAGFTQCASEACGFLLSLPGLDNRVGKRLVEHLGKRISQSLESNPSLLQGHPGEMSHSGVDASGLLSMSPRSVDSSDQESYHMSGLSDTLPAASPHSLPVGVLPQSKLSGLPPNLAMPNTALNPYQFAYYDSDFRTERHEERQSLPESLPREESSKSIPRSSSFSSTSSDLSGQISFPKLMYPQPTRPVVLPVSTQRAPPVGYSSRRSMSPETPGPSSSLMSPTASMSSASVRQSLPQLSPSISISTVSSVGDMDSRNDRMSPGALSCDESSSCQSEDMWRPW
uniref:Enhancer of split mgamma protein n=2 Tax=Cacopsylla melanoneura TaxID=428564 RepID=A0A8D8RCU6_9HEMI